ncbi:hypothetical protein [Trujillonella humicola]|uniref:hypothetical protein n=1 Tax=Trujillonella humicola TaxID=3383699 RepID=UPI003906940D
MGLATAALVVGSVTGVLAAPAAAPLAEVAVTASLQPVLYGTANAPGTGTQSLRFSARTVGSPTWNLLNNVSAPGTEAFRQLPAGVLSIGQSFEYQVAHCDDTGCTPSGVQTGFVSPALAAGERPGATRLPFTVGDRISAQVDAGSGNLLATVSLFSLQRRNAGPLEVGLAYNSGTRAEGFGTSVGDRNSGWRLSTGFDVRLQPVGPTADWIVYHGPTG